MDPVRYPAAELVDLYHRRWQAETTYFSIKATMLDGRVLRSRSIDGLDQEVYALLTAYQALIRAGDDALTGRPEVPPMERISFTVLPAAATDTVTAGHGIFPNTLVDLVGTIGHAALDALLPHRRQRVKARTRKNPTRKNPTSKYRPNAGQHRSWAVSRSGSWLTGTPRTVLGALVLRFRIPGGDAYPVCAPSQAGGIPTTWPYGCGQRRRGGPEPSRW
ncbi:transposase [Streptomyces sp. NPDC056352]|uniref:transposase n=1 Tax=Streptomyces sp. NPDC056352 TaxID=3345791 RepID=UPI0035D9365D